MQTKKVLGEYYVRICDIDPDFHKNYKEKVTKVVKNGHEHIQFKINVYFSEYNLAVEVDEKGHTDRDLIFEKERQEALEKKFDCKFIRTNPNKENYDVFYEIGRIETFIY